MPQMGFPELVAFGTVAVLLFWGRKIPEVALKLKEAFTNFRGGPGPPFHPIPGDDSKLLNRNVVRADDKSDKSCSR